MLLLFLVLAFPGGKLEKVDPVLRNVLEQELLSYMMKNVAIINVFMDEMTVSMMETNEKTSTISFIANIGGLLGLCIGLSLVTLFELFYHFVVSIGQVFRSSLNMTS